MMTLRAELRLFLIGVGSQDHKIIKQLAIPDHVSRRQYDGGMRWTTSEDIPNELIWIACGFGPRLPMQQKGLL